MYYTINVARNGKHYFATAEHSGTAIGLPEAKNMVKHFRDCFPPVEGYKVTLSLRMNVAEEIEVP